MRPASISTSHQRAGFAPGHGRCRIAVEYVTVKRCRQHALLPRLGSRCRTRLAGSWQGRRSIQCCSTAGVAVHEEAPSWSTPWVRNVAFFAGAMALASAHRATFSVLALPLRAQYGLSLRQLGVLQSAVLAGYMLGQLPAGVLADRLGGLPVMLVSLAAWSAAMGATPLVRALPGRSLFPGLLVARAALGAAQAGIMPATSAMAARWVPHRYRGRALTLIYAAFSVGTVVGLGLTPVLLTPLGWPATLHAYAAAGLAWAVVGAVMLAKQDSRPHDEQPMPSRDTPVPAGRAAGAGVMNRGHVPFQVAVLCWTHSVIGWGFFLFSFWIPAYLGSLGLTRLGSMGALSALPWAASAVVGLGAGVLADWLMARRGWRAARVRALMQTVATLGPAASLLPLACAPQACGVAGAVACITAFMGLQAFAYAGFHAYIQDVAAGSAGSLLGLTNSCATAVGIAANLAAGALGGSRWGFSRVFALTAALYLGSCLTWHACMRGDALSLDAPDVPADMGTRASTVSS